MSFQDELKNIISSEDLHNKELLELAYKQADSDFIEIKKQFEFIIKEKLYSTSSSGSHFAEIMYPQYPNISRSCNAAQYFTKSNVEKSERIKPRGFLSRSCVISKDVGIRFDILNQELFNTYNSHLKELCDKENITYSFVATESCLSQINHIPSSYRTIPGYIPHSSGKAAKDWYIRIYAFIYF